MGIPQANLIGQTFGRLRVIALVGKNRHSQTTWKCVCECGGEKVATVNALRNGMTRSCGCLRKGLRAARRCPEPGKFTCTRCKNRKPVSERIFSSNNRCTSCGPSSKSFSLAQRMWRRAKVRAEKEGLPFTITVEDIVIPDVCPVYGFALTDVGSKSDRESMRRAPSLDRFVPEKGYVPGNVFVISYRANVLKRDGTYDEFNKLCAWMQRFL